jgi:hypothetical protein
MKLTRTDLARRLDALGQRPVVGPGAEFVADLEERLGDGTWQPRAATARHRAHRRGLVAASIAAGVLAIGGSVAALTMARHGDHTVVRTLTDGQPTTVASAAATVAPTSTTTTTTLVTTSTVSAVSPPVAIEPPSSVPPTTAAPIKVTPTTATEPTTLSTEPPTEPSTTAAPVSTTTTTEVHVPTTLALSCSPRFEVGVWSVRCEWSATTYGDVTHYRLLRSVDGQPARAFEVRRDANAYVDTTVERGVPYRYLVRAERAGGTAAETSPSVTVVWPAEPADSTTTSTTGT